MKARQEQNGKDMERGEGKQRREGRVDVAKSKFWVILWGKYPCFGHLDPSDIT